MEPIQDSQIQEMPMQRMQSPRPGTPASESWQAAPGSSPTGSLVDLARGWWGKTAVWWQGLPPANRRLIGVVAGILLLGAAALFWSSSRPTTRILYAALDPQDAREIANQLNAAKIPYETSPDGTTLRVPADYLDKARLQTAGKGGVRSGRMGFDLFDKPNWVGSEFDEKVNYQRALEGELEHTIGTLGSVASARVHLVMPHDSLFTEQQREAKASVVLKLRRRDLSTEEADSIRNLVASAVDDLKPEAVVLVDADGRRPLGPKTASAERERQEQALADKLAETLEPIVGAGNVRTSVNLEYDSSTTDELDESYDPSNVVTLSMQRSEQSVGGQPVPSGVPGTASNAPNSQPPLFPTQRSEAQSTRQESGNYGASKRTRHLVQGAGKIHRITAAVLINDRTLPVQGAGPQPQHQPWTTEQIKHITELAQATVGYDATRGDQISVQNIAFDTDVVPAPSAMGRLWQQATQSEPVLKYLTILLCMAGLILVVLRPAVKGTRRVEQPAVMQSAGELQAPTEEHALLEEESKQIPDPEKMRAQLQFDKVASYVDREIPQSARLLQSWINAEE